MTFVHPQLFWALVVPLVIFALLLTTNKDNLSRIFDKEVLKRLSRGDDSIPMSIRNIISFLAIFLMIVAMARPVLERGDKVVEIEGLNLVTAIDISGSMRSKDLYPNRLEFGKKKLISLLDSMPTDEVSIVAFAHSSFVLAPFSSDKETLKEIVRGVNDKYINMGSTDFLALGGLIAKILEKKKPKIAVIVSDGGDKKDLESLSELLKDNGITLYAILVGTKEGAPVLDSSGKPMSNANGDIAITQLNSDLGEIAIESGGAFVVATNGKEDITKLVSTIKSNHKTTKKSSVNIKDRVEYFYYPLALALLLLLLSFSSLPRRS